MATVNSGIREDANFLNLKEIAQKQVKSEVNNIPVSYTHLDVYKRQVQKKRLMMILSQQSRYFRFFWSNVMWSPPECAEKEKNVLLYQ